MAETASTGQISLASSQRTDTEVNSSTLHHVLVAARDIERSRQFYRDVVELEEIARPTFPYDGAWFRFGSGQHLHLVARIDATSRGSKPLDTYDVHFAMGVRNYRKTLASLRAKGYREDVPDDDLRKIVLRPDSVTNHPQIYVLDPDHNVVEFICDALGGSAPDEYAAGVDREATGVGVVRL